MADDDDDDHYKQQPTAAIVCCMCGDVGFSDKLFRCVKCRHRFQHSYCSNYHSQLSGPIRQCDWCQSEETKTPTTPSSGKSYTGAGNSRSEYSGHKIKQYHERDDDQQRQGRNPGGGLPSPKTRRYKLLKDVMC